jgi:hypothetical protein
MNGQIFEAVIKCFEEERWKYLWVKTAGETRLFTQIPRKNGDFLCMSRIREEKHELVFYIYYQGNVPASKRQEAATFFTQVNDGLTIGNFEMNLENGEVRFRTGVAVIDRALTSAEIDHLVLSGLATAEHYLPGFIAIIRTDKPAKGAQALVAGTTL